MTYWCGYGPATWWDCTCSCTWCEPTRLTRDIWGPHCLYCEAQKFVIVEPSLPVDDHLPEGQSTIDDWARLSRARAYTCVRTHEERGTK